MQPIRLAFAASASRPPPISRALRLTLALLTCAAAARLPAAEPRPSADDLSANAIIARFEKTWSPEKSHMRPLDDEGWKARMTALVGLARLGADAVADLTAALSHESSEVRCLAAQALAFLAHPASREPLRRSLQSDSNAACRLYAADALGKMGDMEKDAVYEGVQARDPNRDVKSYVRFGLERDGRPLAAEVRKSLESYPLERLDSAEVGRPAPEFELVDAFDRTFRLEKFRGHKRVVLIFVYGDT